MSCFRSCWPTTCWPKKQASKPSHSITSPNTYVQVHSKNTESMRCLAANRYKDTPKRRVSRLTAFRGQNQDQTWSIRKTTNRPTSGTNRHSHDSQRKFSLFLIIHYGI